MSLTEAYILKLQEAIIGSEAWVEIVGVCVMGGRDPGCRRHKCVSGPRGAVTTTSAPWHLTLPLVCLTSPAIPRRIHPPRNGDSPPGPWPLLRPLTLIKTAY